MENEKVLKEVENEVNRQIELWGYQNHPSIIPYLSDQEDYIRTFCYGIPTERQAKFNCESSFDNGVGSYAHIVIEELSEAVCAPNEVDRRAELVQLAACVVSWIKCIDRNSK